MPRFLPLTLVALSFSIGGFASFPAMAQDNDADEQPEAMLMPVGAQVANITAENFATLPALLGRRAAISLEVNAATLEAAPNTTDQLLDWTRRGGIVFVHNDAARLFGYQTVAARLGNNRQAGQIYGRAVNALPFGSHPLLQGPKKTVARPADPSRLPGVNVVFYTMQEGDHLVVSHPAGTPLLEVTDLAATETQPLYAAAIAPFGRGFAVFTPDSIDQRRGDGAAFAANLLTLLPSVAAPKPNAPATATPAVILGWPKYVGIPQSAINAGAAPLASELRRALNSSAVSAPALPPLGAPPVANVQSVVPLGDVDGNGIQDTTRVGQTVLPPNSRAYQAPVLMMTRAEALGVQAALQTAPNPTLAILRTRVAILSDNNAAANNQLAALIQTAPAAAETAFLNGVLNANVANDLKISSVDRSVAAKNAADEFARSVSSRPIINVALQPKDTDGIPIAGATASQVRVYATEMLRLARLFSFDPPLATTAGRGNEAIVIRYFQGESTYPLVLQAAQLISSSRLSGWRTDRQEILLFPSEQAYVAYRNAAGATGQNVPAPGSYLGDVMGSRIIMASPPAGLAVLTLGAQSRLQSYAQLTAWFDGNGRIPAWLAIGLENQISATISNDVQVFRGPNLENTIQAGGLLTPAQFENQAGAPSIIASNQASALVEFFYSRFGAGALTETIQRLAAGENIDDALDATTGVNQLEFFQLWRNARFGPRTFPNQG